MNPIPEDRFYNQAEYARSYSVFSKYPQAYFIVIAYKTSLWTEQCRNAGGNLLKLTTDTTRLQLLMGSMIRSTHHMLNCRFLEAIFRLVDAKPPHSRDLDAITKQVERSGILNANVRPTEERICCANFQTGKCTNKPRKIGTSETVSRIEIGGCAYRHWCAMCSLPHPMINFRQVINRIKGANKKQTNNKPPKAPKTEKP